MERAADRAFEALRACALSYPETREDHPWGEPVAKVRDKVFVFFGREDGGLSLSVKLPSSAPFAFDLPYCTPTGYGLGKACWVTARFAARDPIPVEVLRRWIDESYRAVAPKTLHARIGAAGAPDAPSRVSRGAAGSRGPRSACRTRRAAPRRSPAGA